ncbi:di-heme-cytochrome C peroxidase [Azospirillum thermophilum]|uniref:Cytochrome c domain-containing protein n=1 Tax=Azospirillum thermophilum TaxID=2202148 RepID=A0A2S2CRI1_9PROT|nr:di-heme-cytochrome C peroxidase [Azospirillum thermophilum]AWK87121.1 hypothetical protein DEW08_13610 [Azospirillum thermophilum]
MTRIHLAAAALLLNACADQPPAPPRTTTLKPLTEIGGIWYLDQNWDQDARQWYYNTTQGSQIMPYDWFMALVDPATGKPFVESVTTRFGYLAGSPGKWNPDRLPVGFAQDKDADGSAWIGMTCAACHTGDVRINGRTIRVDGAVTTGDLYAFIDGLSKAVHATATDEARFAAFAERVLGPNAPVGKRISLAAKLKSFDKSFAAFVAASTPDTPWGPMRTDAFGMIFNRVSAIDLNLPKNNRAPNAPVSYPYLWDAAHQPKVQWNGLLDNKTAFDALGRNAGEVLGVFGKITLKPPADAAHYYYSSTVRGRNLVAMENQLRALRSPLWPEQVAGRIDPIKAAAGEEIYTRTCGSCHAVLPREKGYDTAPITMVPLFNWPKPKDPQAVLAAYMTMCAAGVDAAVAKGLVSVNYAADPKMALDAVCRKVDTGVIAGVAMPPKLLGGAPLDNPDLAANLLSNAVIGAIFGDIAREPGLIEDLLLGDKAPPPWKGAPEGGWTAASAKSGKYAKPVFDTTPLVKKGAAMTDDHRKLLSVLARQKGGEVQAVSPEATAEAAADTTAKLAETVMSLLAYKARPLDGVWATAPYMHNGSVPNLYEMLLPPEKRSVSFRMGTTAIDPVKVGVDTAAQDNSFVFDTTKPGNRNTGHDFGKDLSDEQRWQLIEYVKSL